MMLALLFETESGFDLWPNCSVHQELVYRLQHRGRNTFAAMVQLMVIYLMGYHAWEIP